MEPLPDRGSDTDDDDDDGLRCAAVSVSLLRLLQLPTERVKFATNMALPESSVTTVGRGD